MAVKSIFNVAVVGFGLSAKVFHIPFIQALPNDFKLYGIVQRRPTPDNDASKVHADIKHWRNVDEVYRDPDVDTVVITTPPETHFEIARSALQAGKHVVVEKPFVTTSREADELVAISRRKQRLLTVYQNRRWDADFLTLRKLIQDATLGDIAEFETHFDRHRPDPPAASWKTVEGAGNGAIYDLGTHLIDQVYHLFGMPQRVTGFVGNQRRGVKGGAHDSFTVLLHYEHMLVTCKAGVVSPEEEQLRYWVKGTKGSFKKFHLDPQEDQLRKEGLSLHDPNFAHEPTSHHGTLTTISADGKPVSSRYETVAPPTYIEFYRILAEALHKKSYEHLDHSPAPFPVEPSDARNVIRIIELALRSSKEEKTLLTKNTLGMSLPAFRVFNQLYAVSRSSNNTLSVTEIAQSLGLTDVRVEEACREIQGAGLGGRDGKRWWARDDITWSDY